MNFKKSKWLDYKFSKDQKQARAMWRRSQKYYINLTEALLTSPERISRQELHDRLDYVLNNIERTESAARELFPEVSESFTIATLKI